MEGQSPGNSNPRVDSRVSWMPLLVIILAQILLNFNRGVGVADQRVSLAAAELRNPA
jgi:hypothetical protein